ncbi:hypothetical protein Poli38472_003373 [Pythium oligandrum]|uniref:Uncharacterized protein n=1 Tax=Pythium oligandrum TaxID=41045 RepID=A0A8K1FG47_PYTOL|nr:hypothetical protein Poli38472_003373 [Pythium oligandrum]|eukprot:TMW57448.1 hypothetical protein Poli38472_003373 [Pythium oligandrum]
MEVTSDTNATSVEAARAFRARRWGFHALLLACGQSQLESTSQNELLSAVSGDEELRSWSRHTSYRTVTRQDVEALVRVLKIETIHAERALLAVPKQEDDAVEEASDEGIDPGPLELTPKSMATAFQRLVRDEKKAFHEAMAVSETRVDGDAGSKSDTPPARIYLLTDYPASIDEVHALLLLGESTPSASPPTSTVIPLIDGVLLVVDPVRELRERRKSLTNADERRKSAVENDDRRKSSVMNVDDRRKSSLLRRAELGEEDVKMDKSLPSAAVVSVFETANPFVRDLHATSTVGGLEWSDFAFTELPCCTAASEPKTAIELVNELTQTIEEVATHKTAFKEWVSSVKMISLPTLESHNDNLMVAYNKVISAVHEPSVSVTVVLFAMREAIVKDHEGDNAESDREKSVITTPPDAYIDHHDAASRRLALSYAQCLQATRSREAALAQLHLGGIRLDHIEKAMWCASDLPGIGNQGRKGFPRIPQHSAAERSIQDTEFATFSLSMSVSHVHLLRQLLSLEYLLGLPWKERLRVREYSAVLASDLLAQRLAEVLRDAPAQYRTYYEPADALLVAMLNATAPGRFRATSWSAKDSVRHRPAFRNWKREPEIPDEYLTPRTALAVGAVLPLSSGELGAMSEKCSILYPADQSLIKVYQRPQTSSWLSVSRNGDMFGLRPRESSEGNEDGEKNEDEEHHAMCFYANFQDDSLLIVRSGTKMPSKPDGFGSISMTQTLTDGLVITTQSDGVIVQQRLPSVPLDVGNGVCELYRVISGKGTVMSVRSDGSRAVLQPNGDVRMHPRRTEAVVDRQLAVDPETNALVEKRGDGTIVVTHTDGGRIVYHRDGTRIVTTSTRLHVLITHAHYADVCIDVDVNITASRHAAGEKVAVTKGGLRTRSIIRAPDGTEVEVQYNTNVVAEVNGRIIARKRGGATVIAKDSGRVEYHPRELDGLGNQDSQTNNTDDDDRNELHHNCVYYFDCQEGNFSLVDHEQNHFQVDLDDGLCTPSVQVQLAGVLSEEDAAKYEVEPIPARAVINDPIEPHLFILHGDGTGREILRPRDIHEYLSLIEASGGEEVTQGPTAETWKKHATRWTHERVFLQDIQPSAPRRELRSKPWFSDSRLNAEFERLQYHVTSATRHLPNDLLSVPIPDPQLTVVRRLQQLRPVSASQFEEMLASLDSWRAWQQTREVSKDRFRVEDPRDAETIAQEALIQRKVLVAMKATRARRKLERQQQKEQQRREQGSVSHMETVQEGDEAGPDEDDDFELDHMLSDGSDLDSNADVDVEVDDIDQLMWTAFSEADVSGAGRLALAPARQALVQVLGIGITTSELRGVLRDFCQPEPFAVSFDVFVDVVHTFQQSVEDLKHAESDVSGNQEQHDASQTRPSTPKSHVPAGDWRRKGIQLEDAALPLLLSPFDHSLSRPTPSLQLTFTPSTMAGEPAAKRQRTGDKDDAPVIDTEKLQAVVDAVNAVEEEIEKENEKMAREVLAIESKYNKAKRPFFVKRSTHLRDIPGFWKQVLVNHPLISFGEHDEKILEHLEDLDVTFVDDNGGFKIELTFGENEYFGATKLWKQIKYSEEGEAEATASELKWKESDAAKAAKEDDSSFVVWFVSTEDEQDVAEMIKDDVWKNPVPFYLGGDDSDEEGDDDDEEGDDDDESAEDDE